MMSLEALRKLLGSRAQRFSDEELEEIRHDIYAFAHLAFDIHQQNPDLFNKFKK